MGIASFAIGMLTLFLDVGVFGIAGYLKENGQQTPTENAIIGSCILLVFGVCLLGIGLGIAGAVDRTSKKVFPIIGIVLCTGVFLLTGALVAVGIMMVMRGLA